MSEKAKAWFEATNDLCWTGCIAKSTWEECDFLHDEITEMWEAAQPKWLPIASAPKDGLWIIICHKDYPRNMTTAWFDTHKKAWHVHGIGYVPELIATHWQLRPEPPNAKV